MAFTSGTCSVGEDEAAVICGVPPAGVKIRNLGNTRAYFGGADVGTDGAAAGYPLDPGESTTFAGAEPRESPVVPAPEGDMDPPVLYGRTAAGTGSVQISYIAVSMT